MIEVALSYFRRLLDCSWADINALEIASGQEGLAADWMQASWETVVEAALSGQFAKLRLAVYGDGADCHPRSSRFSSPIDLPTHQIICRPRDEFVVDALTGARVASCSRYSLDRFVSVTGGWYYESPPFDHALLDIGQEQCVVKADRLIWGIGLCGAGS